jgi:hypothetical protein
MWAVKRKASEKGAAATSRQGGVCGPPLQLCPWLGKINEDVTILPIISSHPDIQKLEEMGQNKSLNG